jgi:hypothetical protein
MTILRLLLLALLTAFSLSSLRAAEEWTQLFNGKDLSGWRANTQPEAFTVVDGAIRAHAKRPYAHLFFVADEMPENARFKNFELEVVVRGEPNSNSGIFFHSDISSGKGGRLALAQGYEVQLNSAPNEARKTGSLYAVVDLAKSPVDETEWFRIRIRVEDKHIVVHVNDEQVVDYTEPENPERPHGHEGKRILPEGGAIALQAHDPRSVFHFKEIRIRRLPDQPSEPLSEGDLKETGGGIQ